MTCILSCKDDHTNEIKQVEVKKSQNVNEEAYRLINKAFSNTIGDSLLVINSDTLVTYPFFKFIRTENSLLFSDKGKLSPLADSLLFIGKTQWSCGRFLQ
ncbi:MAG: hypothetical protein K0S12_1458 [Bacteroidetes bacterium]|nr:hypothetical protein [Bacteroidota bacterium]